MYMKLVIASLDYSQEDWGSRDLVAKVCREGGESERMYAAKFLGLLVRTRTPYIAQWGIDLLISLYLDGTSSAVAWQAFDILDEACDEQINLGVLLSTLGQRSALSAPTPTAQNDGDRHTLLTAQLFSTKAGLQALSNGYKVAAHMDLWCGVFNRRYLSIVDGIVQDAFSQHQRSEGREYSQRRSHDPYSTRDAFLPPHLFGQLAATREGADVLMRDTRVMDMILRLRCVDPRDEIPSETDLMTLRAMIWAVVHIVAGAQGDRILGGREGRVDCIRRLIALAEMSPHMDVRGTAFYALSLVSSTASGAAIMRNLNWLCHRRSKDQLWPVMDEWLAVMRTRALEGREWVFSSPGAEVKRKIIGELQAAAGTPSDEATSGSSSKTRTKKLSAESVDNSGKKSKSKVSRLIRSLSLRGHRDRRGIVGPSNTTGTDERKKPDIDIDVKDEDEDKAEEVKRESVSDQPATVQASSTGSSQSQMGDQPSQEGAGMTTSRQPALSNIVEETPSANLDELAAASIVFETKEKVEVPREMVRAATDPPQERSAQVSPVHSEAHAQTRPGTEESEDKDRSNSKVSSPERMAARPIVRRSKKRALSESEAANVTVDDDPTSLLIRSIQQTGGSDAGAATATFPRPPIRDFAAMGQQQQSLSITSMSSAGSYDSPGHQTLRNMKRRHRPALSDSGGEDSGSRPPAKATSASATDPEAEESISSGGGGGGERRARTLDMRTMRQRQLIQRQRESRDVFSSTSASSQKDDGDSSTARPGEDPGPEARYWGVCLPVRPTMLFDFVQEEGHQQPSGMGTIAAHRGKVTLLIHNNSTKGTDELNCFCTNYVYTGSSITRGQVGQGDFSKDFVMRPSSSAGGYEDDRTGSSSASRGKSKNSAPRPTSDQALYYHDGTSCLSCSKVTGETEAADGDDSRQDARGTGEGASGGGNSDAESVAKTAEAKKGRRKEVLKLVSWMMSSVGTKNVEQALLS